MEPTLVALAAVLAAGLTLPALLRAVRPAQAGLDPATRRLVAESGLGASVIGEGFLELSGVAGGYPTVVRVEAEQRWIEVRLLHPVADTTAASADPEVQRHFRALEGLGTDQVALSPLAVRATDLPRRHLVGAIPLVRALAVALEAAGSTPWRTWAEARSLDLLRRSLPAVDPATALDRVLAREAEHTTAHRQPDRLDQLLVERTWAIRVTGETAGVPVEATLSCGPGGPSLSVDVGLGCSLGGDAVVRRRTGAGAGVGHPVADMLLAVRGEPDPRLLPALTHDDVVEAAMELLHGHAETWLDGAGVHLRATGEQATPAAADLAVELAARLRSRLTILGA